MKSRLREGGLGAHDKDFTDADPTGRSADNFRFGKRYLLPKAIPSSISCFGPQDVAARSDTESEWRSMKVRMRPEIHIQVTAPLRCLILRPAACGKPSQERFASRQSWVAANEPGAGMQYRKRSR